MPLLCGSDSDLLFKSRVARSDEDEENKTLPLSESIVLNILHHTKRRAFFCVHKNVIFKPCIKILNMRETKK